MARRFFGTPSLLIAAAGLLLASGLATAQSRTLQQMGGQPSGRRSSPPVAAPSISNHRGGLSPGSLGRSSFSGIGTGRANIDLLSNPARDLRFPPLPVVRPCNPGHDHPHGGGWHRRDRDDDRRGDRHDGRGRRGHHHFDSDFPYRYDQVSYGGLYGGFLNVGSGLYTGGYGYGYGLYSPVYPSGSYYGTSGLLNLPAPAIAYDAASGAYIYGYGNPYGPGLYGVGPYAPAPIAAPAPQVGDVPRTPTAVEIADYQLNAGMPELAVTTLTGHLKTSPGDARAMRTLSLALLQARRFDDGVATLRNAYRMDPGLASEPVVAGAVGLPQDELRDLVVKGVTYANRVDTGSAWLAVTVLMQAEGRGPLAKSMLEKASKKGLEPEVLGAMRMAL